MDLLNKTKSNLIDFCGDAFIDGQYCPAVSGEQFDTINPATGKVLASIANCDQRDVEVAVTSARNAFSDGRWSHLAPKER